jgi:DNA (cytosine-5)-methyltransferase 1
MSALYNEIEPYAAAWLHNLSDAGHIARGGVDARSIRDLSADDVVGVVQFHTFAGLGAWSYALRLAGWPDDRPVWTGSCPCQPFSVAGRGAGTADERHLWPEWFRLIRECRPPVVFGEQVASPDGLGWLDAVRADLEGEGYAVGAADLCAAGVGAPHIRQRLYFGAVRMADADTAGRRLKRGGGLLDGERSALGDHADGRRALCDVADTGSEGRRQVGADSRRKQDRDGSSWAPWAGPGNGGDLSDGVADSERPRLQARPARDVPGAGRGSEGGEPGKPRVLDAWAFVEWLPCRDGKARPAQPGLFPLAHGAPARVGRLRAGSEEAEEKALIQLSRVGMLRAYGNAIVPQVAAAFVMAFMEAA